MTGYSLVGVTYHSHANKQGILFICLHAGPLSDAPHAEPRSNTPLCWALV